MQEYTLDAYVRKFIQTHYDGFSKGTDLHQYLTNFIPQSEELYLRRKLECLDCTTVRTLVKQFCNQLKTLTGYQRWCCFFGMGRLYAHAAGTAAITFLKHEPLDGLIFSVYMNLEEQFKTGQDERAMLTIYQLNITALEVCTDHPLMGELITRLMPVFREYISKQLYQTYHGSLKGFRKPLILDWDEIRNAE